MITYIYSIIIIGSINTILTLILPYGENSRCGKYFKYLSALAMLMILLAPLGSFIKFVTAIPSYFDFFTEESSEAVESGNDVIIENAADNISNYIINICQTKFGMDKSKITVKLILDEKDPESIRIDEVQIYTNEKSPETRQSLRDYFKKELLCDVYVFGN